MADRITVVDPRDFASTVARRIARALADRIGSSGACSLVLTGGSTAGPVYERLADRASVSLPWNAVTFYFGDERAVPPEDARSNFRLARETLLTPLGIEPAQVHRMEAERPDLDQAARDYERVLPAVPDLLLLGVGPDGHIASLLPGSAPLRESTHRVVPAFGGDPRLPRLTITPSVTRAARATIVFVAGARKANAVATALQGPLDPDECPAQLVREAEWIVDRDAGSRLTAG